MDNAEKVECKSCGSPHVKSNGFDPQTGERLMECESCRAKFRLPRLANPKYNVDIRNATGVVIGNGQVVVMDFTKKRG